MSLREREAGHYVLDTRNWICPYPKYLAGRVFARIPSGSVLEVLVDCPSAVDDVPGVAESTGCRVLGVEKIRSGEWKIMVRRG